MTNEFWLWLMSGTCTLVVAMGGFSVRRVFDELDRQRDSIKSLFKMTTEIRLAAEKAKADLAKEFATKGDLDKLETSIYKKLDGIESKLDAISTCVRQADGRPKN